MPQVKKSPAAPAPLVSITTAVPEPQIDPEKNEEKKELSPTWFWDLIAGIPSDEWGKVYDVWLLRRGESKVPMAPGEKGYLDQFMQPITPAVIKQRYGGGLYRAVLNKNGRFKTSHDFEIEGPAIYSSREMSGKNSHAPVNGSGNDATLQVLQQFRELLRDEFVRRADSGPGSSANEEAIKLLSSASERAMEVITKQVPSGASSTQQLAELVTIVKGLMPAQQESGLLGVILKPLLERALAPVDPLTQITSFLAIFEKIDALRGEGGGKAKDWKAMLAEGIVQRGPEILREIRETQQLGVEAARERRAAAETNARTAEIMRTVPRPAAAPVSAAAPQSVHEAPPASAPLQVTPLSEAPEVPATDGLSQDMGDFGPKPAAAATPAEVKAADDAIAGWVKQRIVQLILEGEEPERIVDFLDIADPTVSDLLVKYSEEVVSTFLAGDPILKLAVEHPNWKSFLGRARAYIQESEKLETATPN